MYLTRRVFRYVMCNCIRYSVHLSEHGRVSVCGSAHSHLVKADCQERKCLPQLLAYNSLFPFTSISYGKMYLHPRESEYTSLHRLSGNFTMRITFLIIYFSEHRLKQIIDIMLQVNSQVFFLTRTRGSMNFEVLLIFLIICRFVLS